MIDQVAPADVSIRPSSADMLVGKVYEISCSSSGSRPPPVVTWYLDNIRLGTLTLLEYQLL